MIFTKCNHFIKYLAVFENNEISLLVADAFCGTVALYFKRKLVADKLAMVLL